MTAAPDARAVIGRTRLRVPIHKPWYVWAMILLLPLALGALVLATGDAVSAAIACVLLTLLATLPLVLVLRAWRIHVTDRAIVVGPFLPGFSRDVHLLADIDLSTLRTWSNVSAYTTASRSPRLLAAVGGLWPGARHGISYAVQRAGSLQGGRLTENRLITDLGGTYEVYGIAMRPERMVRAIAEAAQQAGIAPADQVLAAALPPGRLSSQPDAHLREMPGHPVPRQERFEDLPPEMQERLKRHIIR